MEEEYLICIPEIDSYVVIYRNAIDGLAKQDLTSLKKNKKQVSKLSDEVDNLRDNLFFFFKNLEIELLGKFFFFGP